MNGTTEIENVNGLHKIQAELDDCRKKLAIALEALHDISSWNCGAGDLARWALEDLAEEKK